MGAKSIIENEMDEAAALAFIERRLGRSPTAREAGEACYRYYTRLTGLRVSERDEEGYWPDPIAGLDQHFHELGDGDEFQEGWNEASQAGHRTPKVRVK